MDSTINTYILSSDHMINETMAMIDYNFKTYWPNSNVTVLGYKTPDREYDNVKFISLGIDEGPNKVCKQLYDFFSIRNHEQFIFGVDDMPLVDHVDNDMIVYATSLMNMNKHIGRFGLTSDNVARAHNIVEKIENNNLIRSFQTDPYKISCTYSIWNSEYFLLYLKDFDNLWQFELQGSQKSNNDSYEVFAFSTGILNHSHMFKKGNLKQDWYLSCYTKKPLTDLDKTQIKKIYKI